MYHSVTRKVQICILNQIFFVLIINHFFIAELIGYFLLFYDSVEVVSSEFSFFL